MRDEVYATGGASRTPATTTGPFRILDGEPGLDLEALGEIERDLVKRYHHDQSILSKHQCGSTLVHEIKAPIDVVWGIVRRFDQPQIYKHFLQSCLVITGDGSAPGSVREVRLVSGLPGTNSIERLELLDDHNHIISFRILGGGHRLSNYWSVTSLHERVINGRRGTLVIESYVADIPEGNTMGDTRVFVDTVIRCNLKSLQSVAEQSSMERETSNFTDLTIKSS